MTPGPPQPPILTRFFKIDVLGIHRSTTVHYDNHDGVIHACVVYAWVSSK